MTFTVCNSNSLLHPTTGEEGGKEERREGEMEGRRYGEEQVAHELECFIGNIKLRNTIPKP